MQSTLTQRRAAMWIYPNLPTAPPGGREIRPQGRLENMEYTHTLFARAARKYGIYPNAYTQALQMLPTLTLINLLPSFYLCISIVLKYRLYFNTNATMYITHIWL